jgi:hypothetical protein
MERPLSHPTIKFDRTAQSGIGKDGTYQTSPFEMLETNQRVTKPQLLKASQRVAARLWPVRFGVTHI